MTKRIIAALLAASFALPSAPAFGQTGNEAATDVAPVTVRAPREPPVEIMPAYAACIATLSDPYVEAMMAIGDIDATPRIFQPTRPPRNPDYNAPPKSRPGSPMPEVMSLKDYQRYARRLRNLRDAAALPSEVGPGQSPLAGSGELRIQAIAKCLEPNRRGLPPAPSRVFLSVDGMESGPSGPVAPGQGRVDIEFRDKTLPLGFALFDDGRYEEALEQFKAAERKLGNPEAPLMIGKIYLFGLKEKSDPVEGVKWLKRVTGGAFNGWTSTPVFDPREPERNTARGEAAMILADLYRDGLGPIARDPAQSRDYLELAYKFGHIRAAKLLGDIYYEGRDTPRDLVRAFRNYMDAAKFAYVPAMIAVSDMYANGEVEGRPDRDMALTWRNEAAKLDDAGSLYAMAVAYDRGEGVKADPDRALSLYKLAAMNGQPAAMTALGTYFYDGEGGLPHDPAIARQWFEQAALAADADGMFNLAAMMSKGEGGAVDRVRAWGWLKIAEKEGHPNAAAAIAALEAGLDAQDRVGVASLAAASSDAPPTAVALGPDPESTVDPAFVGSAPGGPPWWKVSKGDASIWILGLPAGRVTQDRPMDGPALRRALADAEVMITDVLSLRGIHVGGREAALPDPLALKVAAAARAINKPLTSDRVTLSDAFRTRINFDVYSRTTDERSVLTLATRVNGRLRIITPPLRPSPRLASYDPASPEVGACVDAIVEDMATPRQRSEVAWSAWVAGDVAGALAAPRGVGWACEILWPGAWERSVGFHVEAIAMGLEMPKKIVATIDIGELVAEDGVLSRLRERGYDVSGPLQPTEPQR